jgi:hypothetical protein
MKLHLPDITSKIDLLTLFAITVSPHLAMRTNTTENHSIKKNNTECAILPIRIN